MHAFTSASTRSPPRFTPKQCSIVRIHSWETSARRAALGEQGQGLPNPGGCHIRVQHMLSVALAITPPLSAPSPTTPTGARIALRTPNLGHSGSQAADRRHRLEGFSLGPPQQAPPTTLSRPPPWRPL